MQGPSPENQTPLEPYAKCLGVVDSIADGGQFVGRDKRGLSFASRKGRRLRFSNHFVGRLRAVGTAPGMSATNSPDRANGPDLTASAPPCLRLGSVTIIQDCHT
jgi:hypothetical protein